MKNLLSTMLSLAACLLFTVGTASGADDKAVNPTGTWKWTMTGQNGQTYETVLKLKIEGDKLTGNVSRRNGETPIEEAKIKGDEVSFQVTRENNGNKFVSKYKGKVTGDTIKGKIEFDRNGEAQSRDWEAKRSTEAKSETKPTAAK